MTRSSAARAALLAVLAVFPASAQEPEIIILDPNRPLIQDPRTRGPVRPPARAEHPAAELAPLPAGATNDRDILAGLWFRYRALQIAGESAEAARQLATALEYMKRQGLRAAPEIAAALMAEASRSHARSDYVGAREYYQLAAGFAPSLAGAHFGLGKISLRADKRPLAAMGAWWAGNRALLTDPGQLNDVLGNGALLVYLGLCAGGVLALLLLVLRSAPAFFHDLMERSSGRLSEDAARLLGWGVMALPLVAFLPVAWIVALWGALFFTYLKGSEKLVAAAALLLVAAGGPAGRALGWGFATASDPAVQALIASVSPGHDPRHQEAIRTLAGQHPREAVFPFLLGLAYKESRNLENAMEAYRRVLEIDPGHARALVNLGNLYFARQEYSVAQSYYRRASQADPRLALAHYNSHLAHLEAFRLEAADEAIRQARRLDEALVTELLERGGEGRARRAPVDARYAPREVWARALRLNTPADLRTEAIRALSAPATLAGGAGLLASLLLPGIGLAPRSGAARRCRRCGRAFCRRCQVASKYPEFCSQCMHLFILKDGVAPGVKTRKVAEVARYRRRVWLGARSLSLALPGAGHLLAGRSLLGAGLLMGWAMAWAGLLLGGGLLVAPQWIAPAAGTGAMLPLVALAGAVWLAGNISSHEAGPD
jgi:tetratricopeptide (TPR) repeat protein